METRAGPPRLVRFGDFELDTRAGELRKEDEKIRLGENSLHVLLMLVEHPGQTVTREELRAKLWPADTFVDFEDGLNHAIKKLREALGESAENPRFIETLPRRGYRFIVPVEAVIGPGGAVRELPLRKRWVIAVAGSALVVVAAVLIVLNVAGLRDRILGRAPASKIESIAVLPLKNLSGDPEQEYFADGMTDALITELGKISALRVISIQSTLQYKGTDKPTPQIAGELNVDALMEGSVLRWGNRVRVNTQLVQASPERHLWSQSFERDVRDVLVLQGDVARAVAEEVKAKVTPEVQARLARAQPVDREAYELYFQGQYRLRRGDLTRGDYEAAAEYFQRAIQTDPQFAWAYVGLARSYGILADAELLPTVEAATKQRAAARKALEIDETLAEAHVSLAQALYWGDWDWAGGEREYKRALELNPNSAGAHHGYAWYLSFVGRTEEAFAEAKRGLEIDPLSADRQYSVGFLYHWNRQYDRALQHHQRAVELDPAKDDHWLTALIYREKGMCKESLAEFSKCRGTNAVLLAHHGNTYARAGEKAEAKKNLQKLIELSKRKVGTYGVALVYAGLGEKDRAFEWLEKAHEVRDKGLLWLKLDPTLDPLRSDPRFQDLLRRMNFPD